MKIHAITLTVTLIYIFPLNKRNEHVMKIRVRLSEDAGDEQSNYEDAGDEQSNYEEGASPEVPTNRQHQPLIQDPQDQVSRR